LGGALRRPRNGFQEIKKFYCGVYLQPRSNSFYQKLLTKTSARRPLGGGQKKPIGERTKILEGFKGRKIFVRELELLNKK